MPQLPKKSHKHTIKRAQPGHIVTVLWEDSWANEGGYWTEDELQREEPLILETTGRVVFHDRRGMGLTMQHSPRADVNRHVQFIPGSLIRKVSIKGRGIERGQRPRF